MAALDGWWLWVDDGAYGEVSADMEVEGVGGRGEDDGYLCLRWGGREPRGVNIQQTSSNPAKEGFMRE